MSELEKAKTFEERIVNEFNEVKRQVGVLHTQLDGVQTRLGEVVNELKKSQIKGDEMEAKQAETQKQVDELREDVNRLRKSGTSPETDKRNCGNFICKAYSTDSKKRCAIQSWLFQNKNQLQV